MPFLYLVKCQSFYKIGVASNIESRLASLQTGNPYPLEVVCHFEFENPAPVEQALHQRFEAQCERLEWFNLSASDIATLNEICLLLGGKRCGSVVNVTESDVSAAEVLGVANDDAPILERIEKLLAEGWRLEFSGSGEYKKHYVTARRGSGLNREGFVFGKATPEILPYLYRREGKGNRR